MEKIVLGGGCFWCTEAAFKQVNGVKNVTSGYAGGHTENPIIERYAAAIQVMQKSLK